MNRIFCKAIICFLLASVSIAANKGVCFGKYYRAYCLYIEKKYCDSYLLYKGLGDFLDSETWAKEARYQQALECLNSGDVQTANRIFSELYGYKKSLSPPQQD